MAVDPNNWVPQFDERQEQDTITPVTQPDGSIRYFLGNYEEAGGVDRVRILDPGKYARNVVPRVQLVDENGADLDHRGALFHVTMKNGEVYQITCPIGHDGSGFASDATIAAKLVVENAQDQLRAGAIEVVIKSGQWLEGITASEVDRHNENARAKFGMHLRQTKPKMQNVIPGVADERGLPNTTITRDSLKGQPGL